MAEAPADGWHEPRAAGWCEAHAKQWKRTGEAQYFTPVVIAQYMATLFTRSLTRTSVPAVLRLLDPGAGLGMLSAAAIDAVLSSKPGTPLGDLKAVELVLVDSDRATCAFLRDKLSVAVNEIVQQRRLGTPLKITFEVVEGDFLSLAATWTASQGKTFDVVLSNPPYFKLNSSDARVTSAAPRFGRQTNIYSLFMSYAAQLLSADGVLVFIVPRSFASGLYFRAFREQFLQRVALVHVHVFDSRTDAFRRDNVLQENVIVCARRLPAQPPCHRSADIVVSTSVGAADITTARHLTVPADAVLWQAAGGQPPIIRLPVQPKDVVICQLFDRLPARLDTLQARVATGPAVAFRCQHHTVFAGRTAWPLLWLEHVHPMRISWPNDAKKTHPQYVKASTSSAVTAITVPTQNMVLVRRFSAKEQERRLVVAPLLQRDFHQYPRLGLENHLNFICGTGAHAFDEVLAAGLAAFLSSSLVDSFFRISSGNTQVSAVELRTLPFPPPDALRSIGEKVAACLHAEQPDVLKANDAIVEESVAECVQGMPSQRAHPVRAVRSATPSPTKRPHVESSPRDESIGYTDAPAEVKRLRQGAAP